VREEECGRERGNARGQQKKTSTTQPCRRCQSCSHKHAFMIIQQCICDASMSCVYIIWGQVCVPVPPSTISCTHSSTCTSKHKQTSERATTARVHSLFIFFLFQSPNSLRKRIFFRSWCVSTQLGRASL